MVGLSSLTSLQQVSDAGNGIYQRNLQPALALADVESDVERALSTALRMAIAADDAHRSQLYNELTGEQLRASKAWETYSKTRSTPAETQARGAVADAGTASDLPERDRLGAVRGEELDGHVDQLLTEAGRGRVGHVDTVYASVDSVNPRRP